MKLFLIFCLIMLFKTSSLKGNWEEIETPKTLTQFYKINSGSNFLVATRGTLGDVYFSFDEGETWEKRTNGLPTESGLVNRVIVYNDVVYICTETRYQEDEGLFYLTSDKGKNWQKVNETAKFDSYRAIQDFDINNNIMYLISDLKSVVKSTDFGTIWDTLPSWGYQHAFYISTNNDTIVVSGRGGYNQDGSSALFIAISTDGGQSWKKISEDLGGITVQDIVLSNNSIYIATRDGLIYSNDLGESYKEARQVMLSRNVNCLEVKNDTVFAGTTSGLFISTNKGADWQEIPFFNGKMITYLKYENNKLFVNSNLINYTDQFSYFSTDLINFNHVNFKSYRNISDIVTKDSTIYLSTFYSSTNGVYKANKINEEFQEITKDGIALTISSLNVIDNIIVARLISLYNDGKQILLSEDYGESWEIKDNIEGNYSISDLSLLDKNRILVSAKEGQDYKLLISENLGENWEEFKTGNEEIDKEFSNISYFKKIKDELYLFGKGRILRTGVDLLNWKSIMKKFDYSRIDSVNKDSINPEFYRRITDISVSGDNICITTYPGTSGLVDASNIDFSISHDFGETWEKSDYKIGTSSTVWVNCLLSVNQYVFAGSKNGLFLSRDYGHNWEDITDNLLLIALNNGIKFEIYEDKIIYLSGYAMYYKYLSELGIDYTSVEKTEDRNYLWTNPPYPQPSNNQVKVEVYWDSGLPFTSDDVEIYDLTGVKININGQINVKKENNWKGNIIWDASNQNPGIYIMKITHGTETRTRKILITE